MKFIVLLLATLLSCQSPTSQSHSSTLQEDTVMIDPQKVQIEYYDFKNTQNGTQSISYEKGNGWLVVVKAMKNVNYGGSREYTPAIDFYELQKAFYQNGMIKERGFFMSSVAFGRREYFDEQRNCTKIVDEDKKFGVIKREDVLQLLEKEGWFNRQTGENIITEDSILPTNYNFYREITQYMKITFKRAVLDKENKELEPPKWFIEIEPRNEMYITRYIIDGNTGRFDKKESFEPRDE